jgi:ribosomal protein L28
MERRLHIHHTWPLTTSLSFLENPTLFLFFVYPFFRLSNRRRTVEFPPRDPKGGKAKHPQSQPQRKGASKPSRESDFIFVFCLPPYFGSRIGEERSSSHLETQKETKLNIHKANLSIEKEPASTSRESDLFLFLFTPLFRLSNRRRTVEFHLETQRRQSLNIQKANLSIEMLQQAQPPQPPLPCCFFANSQVVGHYREHLQPGDRLTFN